MFKINDMTCETRQEDGKWRVKIVHDDGREVESTKPFDSEYQAIDAAMRYCLSYIGDVIAAIEERLS